MRNLVYILLLAEALSLTYVVSYGQNALPAQIRLRETMDGISDPGGVTRGEVLYGVEVQPGRILGDYYLDSKWNQGSLLAYGTDKVIDGYYMKYDIEGNSIEIKVGPQIKLISVNKIESIIWRDSITNYTRAFVNSKDYTIDGEEINGLIEILEDGMIPLVKRTTIWIKRPDYVMAFDVGSKDTQINKRDNFYYAKGKELIEIKRKKDLLPAFGDRREEMAKYIKVNKWNLSDERHLRGLFRHFNSMVQAQAN